jgi:trans-aconitate methyltransferase
MKRLLDLYTSAFREHGDSHEAVLWPKGRQKERFHALTRHIRSQGDFSVLDYGCGLAHLKPFLDARYGNVAYTGADAVDVFIQADREKYPESLFHHVASPADIKDDFDYVLSSGAFNILYSPDRSEHRAMVFRILEQLFDKARVCLSVNMMTDVVDFQQPDAYHQNVVDIYGFACEKLSCRLMVDQSYMPYEFTLTVWQDQRIRRPENMYDDG